MANEDKKDFNAKMNNSKDMPKIVELDSEASKKWGGKTMVIAPPIDYDKLMKDYFEKIFINDSSLINNYNNGKIGVAFVYKSPFGNGIGRFLSLLCSELSKSDIYDIKWIGDLC